MCVALHPRANRVYIHRGSEERRQERLIIQKKEGEKRQRVVQTIRERVRREGAGLHQVRSIKGMIWGPALRTS